MSETRGPFRPEHVSDGDRYEISRGHPVHVAPAGGRHGKEQLVGALPLATDPAVQDAGIDVGYVLDEQTLRAPDIAIGNVPAAPGWVRGAPLLAVEYADRGTDEEDLQRKIEELLRAGTRVVWIVRLLGPRRVDVHAAGRPPTTVPAGGTLHADGILSRSIPADALFDRTRAREIALDNLLRDPSLTAEVHQRGVLDGLREAVRTLAASFGLGAHPGLEQLDVAELRALVTHLAEHRRWDP